MKNRTLSSQTNRGLAVVALVSLATALAGCSGEPSSSDVDKTVRKYLSESQAQLQRLSGTKNSLGEIHDVKKLGCKADTDVSWRCDVELDMTQAGTRNKAPAQFRFVKGSDGWSLSR
ncbi:hypothetical protein [Variovorax sp. PAMC26660]|uniref:hypothetical protein n=1 Tax=Variovorax sp. PAMC26660 TaxID=2762322 RepID=UPI00164D75AF|nr:hypothetical protein [Variovorax sp. PAMC26660]QNK65809.1 hypothetical protein H7F35_21665 [Variovorax sp. PAMC26660]